MKFKVGDTVKVVKATEPEDRKVVGQTGTVSSIDSGEYPIWVDGLNPLSSWHFAANQLKLINKEGISMSRLYRVVKDTPAWTTGAILEEDGDSGYQAMNDLWDAFEKNYPTGYTECAAIVENSDFFERVYEVKLLGKAKYLNKVQAREAHDNLYKEK